MSNTHGNSSRTKLASLGYGLGSVWQRADGSLYHVYSADGRQHEERLKATTLPAARRECSGRNTKKETGELPAPSRRTLGDTAAEFFALQESLVTSGELRPRTVELYKQRWRSHLETQLAGKPVQK